MTESVLRGLAGLVLLSLAPVVTPVQAQSYRRLGDWLAFCDNLRSCSAFGTSKSESPAFLRVTRAGDARAEAEWSIGWSIDNLPAGTRLRLRFADPKLAGLPADPVRIDVNQNPVVVKLPGNTDALIGVMREADALTAELLLPQGQKLPEPDDAKAEISLNGAVAALLWIDDQQKRVGTPTALIKKGSASAVPPVPAEPVVAIAAAIPQDHLPAQPPAGITKVFKASQCELPTGRPELKPAPYRVSSTKVLWDVTCTVGAYSTSSLFFLAEGGGLKPVTFEQPTLTKDDKTAVRELSLAEFDSNAMEVRSVSKDRGAGDCGNAGRWGWDGTAFRLLEFKAMPECKGVAWDFWPVVYRAKTEK